MNNSPYKIASIWSRLGALLIDLLVAIIPTILTIIFTNNYILSSINYSVLCLIYYFWFTTISISYTRTQTIGLHFLHIQIVDNKKKKPSRSKSILNNSISILFLLLFTFDEMSIINGIILLTFPIVFSKIKNSIFAEKITLWDWMTNTIVIMK